MITRVVGLMVAILASPFVEGVVSAFPKIELGGVVLRAALNNAEDVPPPHPKPNQVRRIKVVAGKSVKVVPGFPIVSAVVSDLKVATAETTGGRGIMIKGLLAGSTSLIVEGKTRRITYGIVVEGSTLVKSTKAPEKRTTERTSIASGSNALFFTPGFNGSPAFLRQAFDYSSKLQSGRTLRMSGDFFKIFDGGQQGPASPRGPRFGPNRMTFGADSPKSRVDLLDSQLDITQMGLIGYPLRGLHLVSTSESRWRGLEIFAGTARPHPSFHRGEGRIAGAIIPISQSKKLRLRAGTLLIDPNRSPGRIVDIQRSTPLGSLLVQSDLRYTPNDRTNIEAEVAHSNGGLSWRTKLDLHRGPFNVYGELARLDESSPLIVIGAQSGGRRSALLNGQWRPNSRFTGAVSYSRNTVLPPTRARNLQFTSGLLLASVSFAPLTGARVGVIFNNYVNESPAPRPLPFLFKMETSSLIIKYDQTVTPRWANEFEAQVILNREGRTTAQMGRGLNIRDQLRYTSKRGSITGLGGYRSNTPSFESLVVQNPAVLPAEFREAFGSDPATFILRNRKVLPVLLNRLNRPLSHNWDFGLRLQRTFARLNLTGEATYGASQFMATRQRTLLGSINGQLTLDSANSIQFTASRLMAFTERRRQMSLSVGYVYRFGAGSGDGFQLSRLLRFGRRGIRAEAVP